MIWRKISNRLFKKTLPADNPADKVVVKSFKKRYARFRKLLDANAALADLMAEMDVKLDGSSLFGMVYIRQSAKRAVDLTRRMSKCLIDMSGGRYPGLDRTVDRIEGELGAILGEEEPVRDQCPSLTLPLTALDLSMVDWVGGKNANLGEMTTRAGLPVPRGFAITVKAFHAFLAHEGLDAIIAQHLVRLNSGNREEFAAVLNELRAIVEQAPLPDALLTAFDKTLNSVFGENPVLMAVRSSAQTEDGDKSFAGQFLTELNVSREGLANSYRRVIASLFTPSATLYRLHQGIPLSASAMGVVCLEMVDAVASGVAYSHDPVDVLQEVMIVNGVWGLGRYAVDGIVRPDLWSFTREAEPVLVRRRAGLKDRRLVMDPDTGELIDEMVPPEAQKQLSLTDAEAQEIARLVMVLEKHYGGYQDVEWAKTRDGRLVLLQSRPLDVRAARVTLKPPLLPQYPLLIEGGDVGYPGVGHGPVVMPRSPEELTALAPGGVLVARHSSPEYAGIMDKVQAVITEIGGITGHMATICREFRVPLLLNVSGALKILKPGMEVTVDAFNGRVYEGKAEELLPLRLSLEPVRLQDTPVHTTLYAVSRLILPLNLTDPAAPSFNPENCRTLHDVMRFAHELSYHEMFAISDTATEAGGVALKLKAPLPIDLHIIDLDGGITTADDARSVTPEEIVSAPLKALLGGMLRPEVMFRKPRPVNMGGFMSVMSQQMTNPKGLDERFGDKSYAIVSDRYMNFSSRVGYHYSVLDSYCGETDSKNYIAFNFQGGAAGEERRVRRVKAIALVLEDLGFSVKVQGDAVKSRFQKYPKAVIEDRLDQIGRLIQVTRQMDMLMTSDAAISRFREDFANGIYQ
ncbi:phosphoenolpyruvate synthase [Desulfosarcina sp. OttesenSCG-928-B08]|nr:phosphoenolpyruvate synthase [Desulfosarcina sp. OttesenSCG-928-B08]